MSNAGSRSALWKNINFLGGSFMNVVLVKQIVEDCEAVRSHKAERIVQLLESNKILPAQLQQSPVTILRTANKETNDIVNFVATRVMCDRSFLRREHCFLYTIRDGKVATIIKSQKNR